jgi:hypothetical protein
MQDSTILKQTFVVTSWLLGISAIWVALLSLVGVTLAGKAVSSISTTPSVIDVSALAREPKTADEGAAKQGAAHHSTARATRPNQ